jgi:hypothetical protein
MDSDGNLQVFNSSPVVFVALMLHSIFSSHIFISRGKCTRSIHGFAFIVPCLANLFPAHFLSSHLYNFLWETPTQVERLLSAEQKATDYRSPDDGMAPDHRPTNACTR